MTTAKMFLLGYDMKIVIWWGGGGGEPFVGEIKILGRVLWVELFPAGEGMSKISQLANAPKGK